MDGYNIEDLPVKLQLVMNDFELFARNFIKIIDNNKNTVPFILNPEQKEFLENMETYNAILKGRQIGFTTFSLNYMLYSAIRHPNTSYMIMSQTASVSKSIFKKLKGVYKRLPHKEYKEYGIFPKVTLSNRDEFELENGSRIVIATANGEDSISGNTFEIIHFSEFGKYKPYETQDEIIATAIPALAKNEDARIIIESTAMGHNYFYELFMKAWKDKDRKDEIWTPFFYSWLAKAYADQYKHTYDKAEKWFKGQNKGKRMTEEDLTDEELELKETYGANYRQLMYRRWYIQLNSEEKFKREFPTTPTEAFSTSSISMFNMDTIMERMQNLPKPLPNKKVLEKSDFPELLKQHLGKSLFLYELPLHKKYYAGVDSALGRGGDSSTITIIDEDGREVAYFKSNKIELYKFADVVNALCRWYKYALIAAENNGIGSPLVEKLRGELHYMNMLKYKAYDSGGSGRVHLGFYMDRDTKHVLIQQFKEYFERGMILINTKDTLDEMSIFIDMNGKLGNKKGAKNHDDLVISHALSVQALIKGRTGLWYVEDPHDFGREEII
ncbi:DNA packaging protein [Alkalihalobacillus sp. 1P02AB]|uniref:phage terminase large subunit family protein n=1 Tax=Alkalihalobacillus sp. 1P02AB TaxID=3132260 RepID=UPI0039A6F3F9